MQIFTIGFTKKSAEVFFSSLRDAGVKRLLDVRLNNVSQLAGFTKKKDLRYFTKAICHIDYQHLPEVLAPTQEMLDAYKKKKGVWTDYETSFLALLKSRSVETELPKDLLDGACLLCSEETPEHCHRRLIAEYLQQKWPNVQITHIP
jgi:uncharacterized protein (DUF488 family)